MDAYRCKESFCIEKCDGDGFLEGEMIIEKGTLWDLDASDYRFIGGEIRLENEDGEWLEFPKEWLDKYFEEVMDNGR